ncbi:hypothetical protein CWATWH0402_3474 [Crocosphaera watsonii WH 0402]|uniref:J domain-containing protein n=1 Tax=Crocosphaera watsonii WH 0402 TaxID=1284629 RepID=T2JJD2_CROWT|nr:hypothetical protein CWATWH0402_3474 [Crocosphaera watsonii WH 0402]
MKEIERYYRVLGLEVGASLEDINEAYRDLAFIWHPDRLPKTMKDCWPKQWLS